MLLCTVSDFGLHLKICKIENESSAGSCTCKFDHVAILAPNIIKHFPNHSTNNTILSGIPKGGSLYRFMPMILGIMGTNSEITLVPDIFVKAFLLKILFDDEYN